MKSLKERFLEKIDKRSDCWLWKGQIIYGYPRFYIKNKMHRANRISWKLFYGYIPGKLKVISKCGNKICVNPGHLFVGNLKNAMELYWGRQ